MFKALSRKIALSRQLLIAVAVSLSFIGAPGIALAQDTSALSAAAKKWEATGKYMTIDGHRIFYHDVGEGPAILLLHGHPSSSYDWSEVVPVLQKRARVISFDHLGWGLSDKPVRFGYTLMELADVTEKIMAKLGITKACPWAPRSLHEIRE